MSMPKIEERRVEFVKAAMQALITRPHVHSPTALAIEAIQYADATLKALDENHESNYGSLRNIREKGVDNRFDR